MLRKSVETSDRSTVRRLKITASTLKLSFIPTRDQCKKKNEQKKRRGDKRLVRVGVDSSSEDGLLASLLGQDGSGFVLSIRVVGQFWGAGGDRALQDGLLQVIKHRRVLFSEEGHGHATLTRTTSTTDTMDVVWRGDGRSNKMNAC